MHVCFVMPRGVPFTLSGGAIATVCMELARALVARGEQVTVLCASTEPALYDVGEVHVVDIHPPVHHAEHGHPKLRWYHRNVERVLLGLAHPPDAVLIMDYLQVARHVRQALPHARVYATLHGVYQKWHEPEFRDLVDKVDGYLCCSAYVQKWISQLLGRSLEQCPVLLHGVDLELFHPRPEYTRQQPVMKVLYFGRIIPGKGVKATLAAVARLRGLGLPVSLTIAGAVGTFNQPNTKYFKAVLEQLRAVGGTHLGYLSHSALAPVVRAHDVVTVLSRMPEGFGLVAQEAMASGCAVVSSDRGGLREACGDAALLVDPEDPEAIYAAMRSLLDAQRLEAQKRKGVARVAGCSWNGRATELVAILRRQA